MSGPNPNPPKLPASYPPLPMLEDKAPRPERALEEPCPPPVELTAQEALVVKIGGMVALAFVLLVLAAAMVVMIWAIVIWVQWLRS